MPYVPDMMCLDSVYAVHISFPYFKTSHEDSGQLKSLLT